MPTATSCSVWASVRSCTAPRVNHTSTTTARSGRSTWWTELGIWRNSLLLLERPIEFLGVRSTGRSGPIFTFSNVRDASAITTFQSLATAMSTPNHPRSKCLWMGLLGPITSTHAARKNSMLLQSSIQIIMSRSVVSSRSMKSLRHFSLMQRKRRRSQTGLLHTSWSFLRTPVIDTLNKSRSRNSTRDLKRAQSSFQRWTVLQPP